MNCRLVRRHVAAWLDDELDPATHIEFERHTDQCAPCQELVSFERSFKTQLADAVGGTQAPEHVVTRAFAALDDVDPHVSQPWFRIQRVSWQQAWPVAAAAAALLVIGSVIRLPSETTVQGASALPDVVQLHSLALPSDVESDEPQHVQQFFQKKLGMDVKPAQFDRHPARLRGARVSVVGKEHVPALFYDVGGRRVTVVVTRSSGLVQTARRKHVGGREVLYHHVGTSTVPIMQHGRLNYVFWGDVDAETLFQLAASARVSR